MWPDWISQSSRTSWVSVFVRVPTYFSCLGSQSSPGRSSLAVCLTSSLSTNRLLRCSAWTMATLIHSIKGGSNRNGLWKKKRIKKKFHLCLSICFVKSTYLTQTRFLFLFRIVMKHTETFLVNQRVLGLTGLSADWKITSVMIQSRWGGTHKLSPTRWLMYVCLCFPSLWPLHSESRWNSHKHTKGLHRAP